MALKDLVAQKSALTEDAIEAIISDFVRYDPDAKEIVPTPAFSRLQSREKVLVYLVALQGWGFVTDEPVATDAKPAHIEECLGIPGGTLRPLLKGLKESHLIGVKNGAYSISPASLNSIKVGLSAGQETRQIARPKRAFTKRTSASKTETPQGASPAAADRRKTSTRKSGLTTKLDGWITNGFFDEQRSLADVHKRFAKEGVIVPQTSISGYLLRLVQDDGPLYRDEAVINGKKVWVYQKR